MGHHKQRESRPRYRGGGMALGACAVLVLAFALTACKAHREQSVKGWLVSDPTAQHPIRVASTPVGLDLHVPAGAYGLEKRQKYELRHFLRQYREKNEGPLTVSVPSGGPNEIAIMHALGDVRREFHHIGVSRKEVQFEAYSSAGADIAPIMVSYNAYQAHAPECGDWSDNLARDSQNTPYRNLGCATQRNLAAMVSNPYDLVEPRGMTPRDSQRRDVIMDKYVKGETTIAEKADEERAKVSEVRGGGDN